LFTAASVTANHTRRLRFRSGNNQRRYYSSCTGSR
jgi:hypothetical protein